ncbi:hypothetical protein EU811_22460 [Arthrobacter sp. TS-15]|uniref:hypothetical protein n=1 Tax=unclassified Arthrobacter TaxID=235627 RepID=UPI00115CF2B2|nr:MULTISPECIES: hypothetical protein [unclassified Arthrobacter]QSZ51435.1 hypothetical protein AYX22_23270 [Arthrobacter sp. D5-1]TQS87537.1 hypothetical protein EU811_22460 [Arthrobacter sp. TS-15]
MKCTVISDERGKIIAIGPTPGPVKSSDGEGPALWHELLPFEGQTSQIVDVPDELLNDPELLANLHQTHRLRGERIEAVDGLTTD